MQRGKRFSRGGLPRYEEENMKIVIIRSPKLLAPLLARLFGVSKKKGS